MHSIRAKAHRHAWYRNPNEPPNLNPFGKVRSRPDRPTGRNDLESGQPQPPLAQSHSESCVPAVNGEEQRPSTGIPHAQTSPINANGIEKSAPGPAMANEKPEDPSARTTDTLATSNDSSSDHKPRNRFLGKFHRKRRISTLGEQDDAKPKKHFTFKGQIRAALFNSWINVLLLIIPVGFALRYSHAQPVAIFVVNFIAIVPLAGILSYATEEIALRVGETLGGLLNATFGNAVELIVSIIALLQNQVLIVKTSLIGSILSNLLLVMGMAFFFGGITRVEQHFNVTVAQTASSLLALSAASLIIPTAFHTWSEAGDEGVLPLSRGTAIILLIVYGCYLFFQLKTHTDMYNAPSQKAEPRSIAKGRANLGIAQIGAASARVMGGEQTDDIHRNEDDEPPEPELTITTALVTLLLSTVCVAFCAEFMVSGIDAITEGGGISKTFVGLILVPIVGNAAEHATAVTVACKDKMDLAIGVAIGSSMQIALLVLPFMVTLGWIIGKDDMTLYFDGFQITVLFVAVLLVNYLIQDGKSHWLEGVLLNAAYIIIATAAYFYPSKAGE